MRSDVAPQTDSPRSFVWRVAAPSVVASVTLLAVAALAAVSLVEAQRQTEIALREASEAMRASAALEIALRDLRSNVIAFREAGDDEAVSNLNRLRDELIYRLGGPERLSPTARAFIKRFVGDVNAMLAEASAESRRDQAERIVDYILNPQFLDGAAEQRIEATVNLNDAIQSSRDLTAWTLWMVMLLGIAGAGAGALAGFGLARSLRRQLVELSVPIRSAAGSLDAVVGPVELRGGGDVEDIEQSLNALSGRVADVVQRLQAAEHESLRNDQLAALGQLAAGLAHELRNPLTAIRTLVEVARSNEAGAQLDGRDLEVVDEELSRLDATLQSFLDYARPPRLERTRIDLRDVIARTVTLIKPRAERQSVVVDIRAPEAPLTLDADAEQLRQVLLNLLLNALDALGNGGRILVTAEPGPAKDQITLCVADDGPGISPEVHDTLFEPFTSSKPSGTGLGLTICRRIVENHGGELTARNGPEGGAEFSVLLPAIDTSLNPASSHQSPA